MDQPSPLPVSPPVAALKDVRRVATVQPLAFGDPRYTDLTPGHGSNAMKRLRTLLTDIAEDEAAGIAGITKAKILFTGHRGCGKTTELYRIEHEFEDRFTPLHLGIDDNLLEDFDYTLLLLWLSEHVVRTFHDRDMPLDGAVVDDVARWFETKTRVEIDDESLRSQLVAGGEATVRAGVPSVFGLKLFARMKSEVTGSLERREEIARTLQRFARELIERVNLLLSHAETVLERHGKPPSLLIVQDNLDRLPGERARTLFEDHGDLLKGLAAHMIFTAPISLKLAPFNVVTVFPQFFAMPMVKIIDRATGNPSAAGIATLRSLLAHRVACETVFTDEDACEALCRLSGGSVRDLVRLLGYAASHARVDGKTRIDAGAVAAAIGEMRNEYRRILMPERLYYKRLAAISRDRNDGYLGDADLDPDKADAERAFFAELLLNGAVLEYNGEEPWYDVHPAIRRIQAFDRALAAATDP